MASPIPRNWSPPELTSLSFPADCAVATEFLASWFDILSVSDIASRAGSDKSAAFWIPDTLEAETTELYFRSALPPDVREPPTYGDILEWELLLRQNISDSLAELVNTANDTSLLPERIPYFSIVVAEPARACRNQTCRLSFDPARLSPINGPGMFIFYFVQCAVASFCAMIIVLGALLVDDEKDSSGLRRLLAITFTAVKDRYDGISIAAATFSLVLPAAIIVHFEVSRPKILSYKDVLLELWVIVYSTTFSVWLYRMGACLRRENKTPLKCPLCDRANDVPPLPSKVSRSSKPTLPAGIIISIALLGLIALTVFYAKVNTSREKYQPFHFEAFWDDVCEFRYKTTINQLIVAGVVLLSYCFFRVVSRFIPRWNSRDGKGRNLAGVLGLIDVVALGLMSWGFLYCYTSYRYQLLLLFGEYGLFGGWSLGQVFAISSLLSLPLLFVMSACKALRTKRAKRPQSDELQLLTGRGYPHTGRNDY